MVKANVLEYKGYQGSVETSIEDDCIHGKILHINDLVTYEASTIAELKKEFRAAVDDYLDTCKAIDKAPEKTFNGVFNVRVSPALHKTLAMRATAAGVPLNNYIASTLEKAVTRDEANTRTTQLLKRLVVQTSSGAHLTNRWFSFGDVQSINSTFDPIAMDMSDHATMAVSTIAASKH